ncbi:MAG: hypothetical protein KME13_26975 [Myxacorys californica WJT36-NPBG1]|jgi:hypothetical protein|nr:hypothetical protein [Myxacorys californica WJT36-NPBG1]
MRNPAFIAIFSALTVSIGSYSSSVYAQEAGSTKAPSAQASQPSTGLTPPKASEGKIDITGDEREKPIENQILAYQSLKEASQALTKSILTRIPANSNVLIYDENSLKDYAFYSLLETLNRDYSELINKENPGEGSSFTLLDTPIAALKSIIEVLTPFITDITITGVNLDVPKVALVAQVAGSLTKKNLKVLYPELYTSDKTSIQKALESVRALSTLKNQANRELEAPSDKDKLASLNAQSDELMKLLSSSDIETRKRAIASLVKGYKISNFLSERGREGHILYTTDILANGTQQTKRNFFFTQLRHSAGVAVTYILFNPRGEIEASDTLYSHTGFVRMNRRVTNTEEKKEE